jgi:hypothetical protein
MNLNTVCLPWKVRLDKQKREKQSLSEWTGNTQLVQNFEITKRIIFIIMQPSTDL